MLWFRYSILVVLFISSTAFGQKFTSKQCLDAKFETSIKHEGKFFGLIKNNLKIEKSQCIVEIKFKNILETKWLIDICREPIHIKVTSKGSQSVYKRSEKCEKSNKSDYCSFYIELYDTLQDYGLIFAEGERENLSTSHGQTYCTFLLLKRYLHDGYLFSKYDLPKNLFVELGQTGSSTTLPVRPVPESPAVVENNSVGSASAEGPKDDMESKADELLEEVGSF